VLVTVGYLLIYPHIFERFDVFFVFVVGIGSDISIRMISNSFRMLVSECVPYTGALS